MYCLRLFIIVLEEVHCFKEEKETRSTLFTTMFTIIFVGYFLKSMCTSSFILIGCYCNYMTVLL